MNCRFKEQSLIFWQKKNDIPLKKGSILLKSYKIWINKDNRPLFLLRTQVIPGILYLLLPSIQTLYYKDLYTKKGRETDYLHCTFYSDHCKWSSDCGEEVVKMI